MSGCQKFTGGFFSEHNLKEMWDTKVLFSSDNRFTTLVSKGLPHDITDGLAAASWRGATP